MSQVPVPDSVTALLEGQLSSLQHACRELQGQLEAAGTENEDLRRQLSDCHQQHVPAMQASASPVSHGASTHSIWKI